MTHWFALLAAGLIVARLAAKLWLDALNRRHVQALADAIPEEFSAFIDAETYRRTTAYTLAKSRLHQADATWGAILLGAVLFSGFLPALFSLITSRLGRADWAGAVFLFATGLALSLLNLPLDWYAEFRLEQRFGFNTTTPGLWWSDRGKGLLLALVLGFPLLWVVLKTFAWAGPGWWLLAWGILLGFQLLMAVLAPILIMPLFNKFSPLPAGSLRDRLLRLARRTQFRAGDIQLMDGSKRSRHSNAFFTGFGAFRKIVLFDTLVAQLTEPELEAVLAHEIGHYKRRHIPKMLAASALSSLLGFYVLSVLARQHWFYAGFGLPPAEPAAALVLFGLLAGLAAFWLSPLSRYWSRRYEYQADAFARQAMGEPHSLKSALRKLNRENLTNLTPHPLYSGFYYSHPTLLERERALGAST